LWHKAFFMLNKILLSFILLIFSCSISFGQKTDTVKKKRIYYSFEQKKYQEEWYSNKYYPKPKINEDDFRKILVANAHYPRMNNEKKFVEYTSYLTTTYDKTGKITVIKPIGKTIFDSVAKLIIKQTDTLWEAGIEQKKKTEMTVEIPVKFSHFFKNNMIYYFVKPFYNYKSIICDSSNTFPALLYEDSDNDNDSDGVYLTNSKRLEASKLTGDYTYGTVSIGFDIDTLGSISEISILNSIHPKLDSFAYNYILSTDKKWISSTRDGIKRNSHKTFNYYFYFLNKINSNSHRYLHYSDYADAIELFDNKKYQSALPLFNKVCNYLIESPELFFYRGINYFNLNNAEKGCEDIKYAQVLAEQYGYPIIMEKDKVMDFLQKSCGEE
jgi:hypothetical protein